MTATEVLWRQQRVLSSGTFEQGLRVEFPVSDGASVIMLAPERGSGLELLTSTRSLVSATILGDLEFLADERLPLRAKPVDRIGTQIAPGESLRVPDRENSDRLLLYTIPLSLLPPETVAVIEKARRSIRSGVEDAYRFLLWRYLPDGTNRDLKAEHLEFSLDGGDTWVELAVNPYELHLSVGYSDARSMSTDEIAVLKQRWSDVPQAYDLLWEARRTDTLNGRLVLLVAALEVGVKTFLSRRMPDTQWLLENIPSPSIRKMLVEQMPLVPSPYGGNCQPPPRRVRRILHEGIEARNALVHSGEAVERQQLNILGRAVHDTIRLLDYYSGEAWALEHVSAETRLEWEAETVAGDVQQRHQPDNQKVDC